MKPAHRWPLHPAPKEGEALSSWLNRIAGCYQMNGHDLLEHDLGHGQVNDLDLAPPLSLLTALAQRSGVGLERLHCMSFSCWMPWLLDSLDDEVTSALETYVFQFSVLLPKKNRKVRHIASWRAWLPMQSIHRACPICLNDSRPPNTTCVAATIDAELPNAWLLARALFGRAMAVHVLGNQIL